MSQHEFSKEKKSFLMKKKNRKKEKNTKEHFALWKKEKEKHMRNTDFFKHILKESM